MTGWLERNRNIVDFTLSSLLRRKGKNVALVIVYTFVVFMLASVMFFTGAIRREASFILKDAPDIVVQKISAGRHDLMPVYRIERIKEIRGVTAVKGRLWGYYFDPIAGANYTLTAVNDGSVKPGQIVIGNAIAKVRLASEGDIMPFRSYDGNPVNFKISGVLSSASDLVSSDIVLVSEVDFRKLFGFESAFVTDLVVEVRNSREIATIAKKISELMPDTRPIVRSEILRTYDSVFNWRSGIMLVILLGAMLAFIIFAWDKASGLSAEEKREIGILKAIGWETSDVIAMKFWEGTAVSLTSFVAGVILAYAHVFIFNSPIFEPVLKGWSVLYPEFRLTPFIDAYQITALFFLTVMPYTVATIVPSWRAATVDPDSVMR